MAARDIQKHFQGLRVDTGRRKGRRDPFADPFDDDSDDDKDRRSRSKSKQSPPAEKETPAAVAPVLARTSVSSPYAAIDALRDKDDDSLSPPKRTTDRRPSPAPSQLPLTRVTDGAGRRGSLPGSLNLTGRVQTNRNPRSAVALAAGNLAYLDDSDDEDDAPLPPRPNRYPSPAPRKPSEPVDPVRRSSTPQGSREPPKELAEAAAQPSLHTVASPFAGTKYLQDSESGSDEEAVSRTNSVDETISAESSASPDKHVKRVDKPKQNGGGVSWRAFSVGRAEQRNTEIEALQTSLRQRGKSIAFGTHALTDDGNRVPIPATAEQIFAGTRGRRTGRGKSPPRRAEDTKATDDELDGGPIGIYDPTQYKTNPFTGVLPLSR